MASQYTVSLIMSMLCIILTMLPMSQVFCLTLGADYKTVNFSDPDHGVVERSYIQYLPQSYSGDTPVPLVLDFHGWTSSAQNQMDTESQLHVLAEEFGFIVIFVDGVPDSPSGWRSWNINEEAGPYGDVCDRDRDQWGLYECHYSCEECDVHTTCKAGMTCYNDMAFVEWLVDQVQEELTIDQDRIHATGFSNGAQFTYYLASFSSIKFASVGIVSGSPLLGFGPLPPTQVPIIDFHGVFDDSIPYAVEYGAGRGPQGEVETIMSLDGMYYYDKEEYIGYLTEGFGCGVETEYSTAMDGVEGWSCTAWHCWTGVVSCTGDYGHGYPFSWDKLQGSRIIWQFMEGFVRK